MGKKVSKPSLFFSHSSRDKAILTRLKYSIAEKTGNTVDIFMSSDGQSIPLGSNWVHTLEEALNTTTLMIAFISSSSLASQWLFFEAGFAYSKSVQVVPVGILGVDLGQVPPPLSLLQGFNIGSSEGLNNIIALINRVYEFDHKASFTDAEYQNIMEPEGARHRFLGRFANLVDRIVVDLNDNNQPHTLDDVKKGLSDLSINYQNIKESIVMPFGLQVVAMRSGIIRCSMAPLTIVVAVEVLDRLVKNLGIQKPAGFQVSLMFSRDVEGRLEPLNIAAALYGSPVELLASSGYQLGDIKFQIDRTTRYYDEIKDEFRENTHPEVVLGFAYLGSSLAALKLDVLLDLLFDRKILHA